MTFYISCKVRVIFLGQKLNVLSWPGSESCICKAYGEVVFYQVPEDYFQVCLISLSLSLMFVNASTLHTDFTHCHDDVAIYCELFDLPT